MNRWLWIWKSYLFFRLYFHYCLSSVHYCEDRSHIHFFIRISHIRFSYIHRQDYNYYKGKMAHNNTQQMESYYNTSINHSINVKQSNDVHFVCDSNNRNKLKIINTGLYMMTIFDECKSTQNSHIQLNINIPFTNCIYNIGLFIVTLWLQSNDTKRKMKSWSLWFQRNFKVIMPLYACLGRRRGIFGEICVGRSFRIFILLRMTWSTIR